MAENAADIATLESYLHPPAPEDPKEAEKEPPAKKTAEEEKAAKEEAAIQKQAEKDARNVPEQGRSVTQAIRVRAASLPTPGSIAFPLLAVLLMLFFVVPIKGKSRAAHLWNVVVGKEAIPRDTISGPSRATGVKGGTGTGMPIPTVYRIPLAFGDEPS